MKIKAEIRAPEVSVRIPSPGAGISAGVPVVKEYTDAPAYTGSYTVTPSAAQQTLQTIGKRMTGNVVVAPIPSNYGLIAWDGSTLTVS